MRVDLGQRGVQDIMQVPHPWAEVCEAARHAEDHYAIVIQQLAHQPPELDGVEAVQLQRGGIGQIDEDKLVATPLIPRPLAPSSC